MVKYKLFSVDDHIIEHPDVWQDRVAAKFKDQAPRVIEEDGRELWVYEGQRSLTLGLSAVVGKPMEEWNREPLRFSDMRRGCYDPKARVEDMLSNGIVASLCFPQLPKFGGSLFATFKDKDLASACVEAYNDFVIDEWCPAGPPGLYVPMTITKLWDPEASAREIERCAARGVRAIAFPENAYTLGLPSYYTDHWDPIWRVCEAADIAVCMHIGSGANGWDLPRPSPEAPESLVIAIGAVHTFTAAVNLMMSPVCRKFPKLKIVWSEGGIGWLPAALERADRQFKQHSFWAGTTNDPLPSDIFRQNMWVCMIEEPVGLGYRHDIGIDRIVWEADYPHADTPWPRTQEVVDSMFRNVPKDESDAILFGNAEKLFNWKCADIPIEERELVAS